ncbi:MAG: mannonate dehydratase [Lachnospiraceae bacterium]
MYKNKMKIQIPTRSSYTDDQLLFAKQMGLENVFVIFEDEDSNYEGVMRFIDRCDKFGLTVNDAGNSNLYKHPAIHLGLEGRDELIEKYNNFNRALGKAGIKVGYITWDQGRVSTTKFAVGPHTRGSVGRIVDMEELYSRPLAFGREYEREEIWANFKYFMDRVLPVCEEADIRLALHPNDPPVAKLEGVCNLIYRAQDYKRAFDLVDNSPYLGMKFCVGCWLEGGEQFGNILDDIKYFVENKKVFTVHYRNISAPLPYFEETYIENGHANMHEIIRQFIVNDYEGAIHCDHVPSFVSSVGGQDASFAYATGYLKAQINSIISELNRNA